jgi:hypothetical protein
MSNGWGVHVKRVSETSSQTYYARVPDRTDAVEAVRKHIGAQDDVVIEARAPVQSTAFDAMGMGNGQVGQWVRS